MYNNRKSYSNSNSRNNYRGGSKRRFGGASRNRRKTISFDPSLLVKEAILDTERVKYTSKNKFTDFNLNERLEKNILQRGYIDTTPIQDQIIPYILEGKDVIGLATTGTGKTAAFLIPLINGMLQQRQKKVLIMAPTRELAVQIEDEFKIFAKDLRLYSSLCIGGTSMNRQIDSLRRRPDIVIGTPGRLIDLEKRKILNFSNFSAIVLDEVDRMFDMGFINDMKYVIEKLPPQRHSLFFSATLPSKMDEILNSFLTNPVRVQVETQKVAVNVNQNIVKINGQDKVEVLHNLLIQEGFDKVLVFGRTKYGLDKLSTHLYKRGFKVVAIHGNKTQSQRQNALRQFKDSSVQIMLATDIASRGLDIDSVTHVINYDLPQTYEEYIHRIGRTGRADKTGTALSFIE